MLSKIRQMVKSETNELEWKYHILVVLKYAKILSKSQNINQEILELAVLLHDIGRFRQGPENHEKTGMKEAEKILSKYKYPKTGINEIKHCIESHKQYNILPNTKYAEIISNADAMAHFDFLAYFYTLSKLDKFENLISKFKRKLDYEWKHKLTMKKAKQLTKSKYNALKLILKDY